MCKGHDLPLDVQNSTQTIEVMIPGNKAGVIIGKGGETIRQLQVVMMMMTTMVEIIYNFKS